MVSKDVDNFFFYRLSVMCYVRILISYLRWPTSVTAKVNSHGKIKLTHGKIKLTHGKIELTHGKIKYLINSRQN